MTLSNAIGAAAAVDAAVLADHSQALTAEHAESVRAAARAAAVTAYAILASPSAARAPDRRIGGARRRRTPMTLDMKLRVIGGHAAGRTIDYIRRHLDNQYDRSGLYKISKQKDSLLSRASEGADGDRASSRAGQYPQVDKALLEWFLAVLARGRKRVPLSLAILRQKASQVADPAIAGKKAAMLCLASSARRRAPCRPCRRWPDASTWSRNVRRTQRFSAVSALDVPQAFISTLQWEHGCPHMPFLKANTALSSGWSKMFSSKRG